MYSLTLLFKNNNIGSNNFIVTVDSTFLNKTMVEVLLEGEINSDSLIDNFNDLENKINHIPEEINMCVGKKDDVLIYHIPKDIEEVLELEPLAENEHEHYEDELTRAYEYLLRTMRYNVEEIGV